MGHEGIDAGVDAGTSYADEKCGENQAVPVCGGAGDEEAESATEAA